MLHLKFVFLREVQDSKNKFLIIDKNINVGLFFHFWTPAGMYCPFKGNQYYVANDAWVLE